MVFFGGTLEFSFCFVVLVRDSKLIWCPSDKAQQSHWDNISCLELLIHAAFFDSFLIAVIAFLLSAAVVDPGMSIPRFYLVPA